MGAIYVKREALNNLQATLATLQTQYAALVLRVAELERNNASGSPSSSPSSS